MFDGYLWSMKVEIEVLDKGAPLHLMHTLTQRALGYFLCSYGKPSVLAQMVYKTKGQVLLFFFFFFTALAHHSGK